jgi:hypothetical protein
MLRDPRYLISLRDEPCLFTGQRATEYESVVAAHIGTAGKSLKSPDDEAIPVLDRIHREMHRGEITAIRTLSPDWLIREAMRCYARGLYRAWKAENP